MPKRRHGEGSIYQRGSMWYIKWTEPGDTKPRYKSFPDRETADKVLSQIILNIKNEKAGLPPGDKGIPTLSVLAKDWLEKRES